MSSAVDATPSHDLLPAETPHTKEELHLSELDLENAFHNLELIFDEEEEKENADEDTRQLKKTEDPFDDDTTEASEYTFKAKTPGSVRARKAGGAATEAISENDIKNALQHLMSLEFTNSPQNKEYDEQDDDEEEEETMESVTPSKGSRVGVLEKTEEEEEEEFVNTAIFDLKAVIAEKDRTIEQLRKRVSELEALLANKIE